MRKWHLWGKIGTVGNIIGNPLIVLRFLKVPCVKKLALGSMLMLLMLGMHSYARSTNILWKASNTPCPSTWIPTSGCWLILIAPQCGKCFMKIWKRMILNWKANCEIQFKNTRFEAAATPMSWKIDVYLIRLYFSSKMYKVHKSTSFHWVKQCCQLWLF